MDGSPWSIRKNAHPDASPVETDADLPHEQLLQQEHDCLTGAHLVQQVAAFLALQQLLSQAQALLAWQHLVPHAHVSFALQHLLSQAQAFLVLQQQLPALQHVAVHAHASLLLQDSHASSQVEQAADGLHGLHAAVCALQGLVPQAVSTAQPFGHCLLSA